MQNPVEHNLEHVFHSAKKAPGIVLQYQIMINNEEIFIEVFIFHGSDRRSARTSTQLCWS